MNIDRTTVADRYKSGNLEAAMEEARKLPRLRKIVENFERTGHGACVNAVMDNAIGSDSGPIWFAYYKTAAQRQE